MVKASKRNDRAVASINFTDVVSDSYNLAEKQAKDLQVSCVADIGVPIVTAIDD